MNTNKETLPGRHNSVFHFCRRHQKGRFGTLTVCVVHLMHCYLDPARSLSASALTFERRLTPEYTVPSPQANREEGKRRVDGSIHQRRRPPEDLPLSWVWPACMEPVSYPTRYKPLITPGGLPSGRRDSRARMLLCGSSPRRVGVTMTPALKHEQVDATRRYCRPHSPANS